MSIQSLQFTFISYTNFMLHIIFIFQLIFRKYFTCYGFDNIKVRKYVTVHQLCVKLLAFNSEQICPEGIIHQWSSSKGCFSSTKQSSKESKGDSAQFQRCCSYCILCSHVQKITQNKNKAKKKMSSLNILINTPRSGSVV